MSNRAIDNIENGYKQATLLSAKLKSSLIRGSSAMNSLPKNNIFFSVSKNSESILSIENHSKSKNYPSKEEESSEFSIVAKEAVSDTKAIRGSSSKPSNNTKVSMGSPIKQFSNTKKNSQGNYAIDISELSKLSNVSSPKSISALSQRGKFSAQSPDRLNVSSGTFFTSFQSQTRSFLKPTAEKKEKSIREMIEERIEQRKYFKSNENLKNQCVSKRTLKDNMNLYNQRFVNSNPQPKFLTLKAKKIVLMLE